MTSVYIGANINLDTHILVAGETGSGKSVCMNALISEIYKKGPPAELYLIDLKYVEFSKYKQLNIPVYTDIENAAMIISRIHNKMMRRYREIAAGNDCRAWPVYLFIDEYAEITAHENKKLSKRIIEKMNSLARLGRAANIHIIIATQYPVKSVVSMQLKMNCQKICMRCNSDIGYRVILDKSGYNLRGRGDAVYIDNYGTETRFQVIAATEKYINTFIEKCIEYSKKDRQ